MRPEPIEQTELRGFLPYVLLATLVVAVLPLLIAYGVSIGSHATSFVVSSALSVALSLGLAQIGAALWQRHPGSRDVVFEDLLLWGFLRRVVTQRRVIRNAERLAVHASLDGAPELDRREHLRVLTQLASGLEAGDPYTHRHSDRVARHAYMVARTLKLPKEERDTIRLAAALHDVGKLNTPREVLLKAGRLTDEEFDIIKRHPVDSASMVADLNDPELIAMVRHHHERLDGSGYPDRIAGDEIPLGARIIAVADTFDAITSQRPYRAARSHKVALHILKTEAGEKLDAEVVRAFLTYYTGRRGMRWWFLGINAAQRLVEFSIAGLQRALANAAVVATATAVVTGGVAGQQALASRPRPSIDRSLRIAAGPARPAVAHRAARSPFSTVPSRGPSGHDRDAGAATMIGKPLKTAKPGGRGSESGGGSRNDGSNGKEKEGSSTETGSGSGGKESKDAVTDSGTTPGNSGGRGRSSDGSSGSVDDDGASPGKNDDAHAAHKRDKSKDKGA